MKRVFLSLVGFVTMFGTVAVSVQSMGPTTAPVASILQTLAQPADETFVGTILKNGDTFVLTDTNTKSRYTLDSAEKARPYEGRTVTITGSVEIACNLIHVEGIQEIA
jgi:hypothetical protein